MSKFIEIPNFHQVKATAEPVPADTYKANISGMEMKTSKAGNEYPNWELTISEGKHTGRKIYHMTFITKGAERGTKELTEAAGVPGTNKGFDPSLCIGKAVSISTRLEKYENPTTKEVTMSAKISRVMKPKL